MKILLGIVLAMVGAQVGRAQEPPAIFRKVSLEEAFAQAKAAGRRVVVDFTAEWCVPCKRMDRTTWNDARVVQWVKDGAIAVQLDIDAHPNQARRYQITAIPVVIVFEGGREFDRVAGYQSPDDLLKWLAGVEQGKRAIDALIPFADSTDVAKRHALAKTLLSNRSLDEATVHYLWLWDHALEHERSYRAVRLSYWAGEIGELCRKHEAAQTAFAERRDASYAAWSNADELTGAAKQAMDDWSALNEQLRSRDQSVAWYERMRGQPEQPYGMAELLPVVYEIYLERGDYAAAGRVWSWPGQLRGEIERERSAGLARAGGDANARAQVEATFRRRSGALYASLLAAQRGEEAERFSAKVFEVDASPACRLALVQAAARAKTLRPLHRAWVAEVKAAGLEVSELEVRLERGGR